MMAIRTFALSSAFLIFGVVAASAGPCNTASRDAGSGKVPGYTGQTTGKASEKEHPPTARMNSAVGDTATSSQDTQRQTQGQPTTAKEADSAKARDEGC